MGMQQRECTPDEGSLWRERYTDGYSTGRGDGRANRAPRMELVTIPAEVPGENGSQYVARHVGIAREIGYTRGYRFASGT